MSVRSIKKSETLTNYTAQPEEFVESGGVKKRRIYYNVDFTEEQQKWINSVRKELKQQKGIQIYQDQVILRFCYAANFDMEQCLQKLDEYNKWFSNPSIQSLTSTTFQLFRQGLVYSYGKTRDGRPFIILNASVLDCSKYSLDNFYQAINHSLNKAIKQFIPGYLEHYYFIIDLNQQLLSLPLTQLAEVIKKIGNAYSGLLHKLMIVNCTVVSKWMYNRLIGFGVISEGTAKNITLHTKEDLQNGDLRKFISENVLEEKYGGLRPNIDHLNECVYRSDQKTRRQVFKAAYQQQETQYFSIEQNEQIGYYKQGACCGDGDECIIY